MRLDLKNYVSHEVNLVIATNYPPTNTNQMFFAVFEDQTMSDRFLGLVTKDDIYNQPGKTFHQLIQIKSSPTTTIKTTGAKAIEMMKKHHTTALAVLDDNHHFIGIIKQEDLLQGFYNHTQEQIQQANQEKKNQTKLRAKLRAKIKKAQQSINHINHHDLLTGLPNFNQITKKIANILKSPLEQQKCAVLRVNIDDFTNNSRLSDNHFESLVLQQVASRIALELKPSDIFSRKSDDEFILVIEEIDSLQDVSQIAKNLLDSLRKPFIIAKKSLHLTISIGICFSPFGTKQAEKILAQTQIALQRAKWMGRNNYQIFTEEMGSKAYILQKREKHLYQALQRNELSICYQPIINTQQNEVVALESLLRWSNPKLGAILPLDFIPLAEKTGLIVPIGDWVLQAACKQAALWQTPGKPIRICVNLSARQFQSLYHKDDIHLIEGIEAALKESNLTPDLLEIEITESVMIRNPTESINTIKKLKNLGLRIACDDFGVGYSSLNYLKYFPIDTIKIDKSFIDGITSNPVDIAIIRAIVLLANQLHIDIVAEGVEHDEQVNILSDIGCTIIQGYYFSKPVEKEKVSWILNHDLWPTTKPSLF